jgi:hypothetical protein
MNEIKSDIGECVSVLFHKTWGKIPIKGQLKKRVWWENRLQTIINLPTAIIENNLTPGIYNVDGTPVPDPIPYEIEILGWSREKYEREREIA